MLKLSSINKQYNDFYALKDIDLQIDDGEFVAIVGESGSGKSTLLNIVGQIDVPSSGELLINGTNTVKLAEKEVAKLRNTTFGFVFQSFYLEPSYTVEQNVEIPLILKGTKKEERRSRIVEVLTAVNMQDKRKNISANLSGGEMQRVAIARAIAADPSIIIADEPCGNLDSKNGEAIMKLLKSLNDCGKTVIMVTHSAEHAQWAKRIIRLCDGKVISDVSNAN